MPELMLVIGSRNFRLAVTPGEEAMLSTCATRVDSVITSVRNGGRLVAQDQIAVMAALEIAYEDAKKERELTQEIERLNELALDLQTAPSAPVAEPVRPTESALVTTPVAPAQAELEARVDELCCLCEEALFTTRRTPSLFGV